MRWRTTRRCTHGADYRLRSEILLQHMSCSVFYNVWCDQTHFRNGLTASDRRHVLLVTPHVTMFPTNDRRHALACGNPPSNKKTLSGLLLRKWGHMPAADCSHACGRLLPTACGRTPPDFPGFWHFFIKIGVSRPNKPPETRNLGVKTGILGGGVGIAQRGTKTAAGQEKK